MGKKSSGKNAINIGLHNRSLVFDIIRSQGPIGRPEIARSANLTTSAITNIVKGLISDGLVEEVGLGESAGGRKPGLLQVRRNSCFAVVADLAGTTLSAAITTITGEIIVRAEKDISLSSELTVNALTEAIREVIQSETVDVSKVSGIGVTAPGLIERSTGTVIRSVRLGWYGVPLKAILERSFNLPIFIGKDTEAAILGEQWYGVGREADNLIYVWVGTGIAIGIRLNGQIYSGTTGMAGEFGHTSIQENGTRCRCGNEGCLEGLAGLGAILERTKKALIGGAKSSLIEENHKGGSTVIGTRITPIAVLDAAAAGDPLAAEIVEDVGHYLGIGVANLINLFNPDLVLIGGQIRPCDEKFVAAVRRTANRRALPEIANTATIAISRLGRDAGLIGATALVWEKVFGSA